MLKTNKILGIAAAVAVGLALGVGISSLNSSDINAAIISGTENCPVPYSAEAKYIIGDDVLYQGRQYICQMDAWHCSNFYPGELSWDNFWNPGDYRPDCADGSPDAPGLAAVISRVEALEENAVDQAALDAVSDNIAATYATKTELQTEVNDRVAAVSGLATTIAEDYATQVDLTNDINEVNQSITALSTTVQTDYYNKTAVDGIESALDTKIAENATTVETQYYNRTEIDTQIETVNNTITAVNDGVNYSIQLLEDALCAIDDSANICD